jgi:pseudouridine-5'-monophosphatase
MRVVWVPHQGLVEEYNGKEGTILSECGLSEALDYGWGEQLTSLEDFPYQKYGITFHEVSTH